MARPVWSGAISFGMVSIPIKLVSAVNRKSISFNRIDSKTMSRVRQRNVAEATGDEVPNEQIVKGYDLGNASWVILTDDDLAPLAPAKSKEISLESFVEADDLDPLMFDSSYLVLPDKNPKPYALLASAMAGTGRVGIGRFVMRQKEYLAAVRSDGTHLTLSTLVFPDELVDPAQTEGFEVLDGVTLSDKELLMARSLVDALTEAFEPTRYVDEYRTSLESLIEQKAAGLTPVAVAAAAPRGAVIDLASALEASLREAKAARERHPAGAPVLEVVPDAADDDAAAEPAPARKPRARRTA